MLNLMVDSELDVVFRALAHSVRREMLTRLAAGELTVGELAAPLAMSLAAASKHLDVLERAGLVDRSARGRTRVCRLNPSPLTRAGEWLRLDMPAHAVAGGPEETIFHSGPMPDC